VGNARVGVSFSKNPGFTVLEVDVPSVDVPPDEAPRFLCDSMLGGLARRLRLAGYDATFAGPIDDGVLVQRALRDGQLLLSSDAPLFERKLVRDGCVRSLFVPRTSPPEQVEFVLRTLSLPVREPRCLACGGVVIDIEKEAVRGRVPPESFAAFESFYVCDRCDRVFWQGSHWDSISATHKALSRALEAE
jgi:uncharacterized protein with PIN domain